MDFRASGARGHLDGVDLAWLALFALAIGLTAMRHELGLDEAQAWNIARSARWPLDVVANGRYEGHTPLWHLVLWPLTLSGDPRSMQALAVASAVVVATLLLRDKPVPRVACVLILFSFFVAYRYTVVPRTYTLTLVLSAVLASAMYRGHRRFVPLACLCGLIGFTGAFGVLLSGALMLVVVVECLGPRPWRSGARAPLALGLAAYLAVVAVAAYLIVFPVAERSTSFADDVVSGDRIARIDVFRPLVRAVFPLMDRLPLGVGRWLDAPNPGYPLLVAGALVVSLAIGAMLRGWRTGQAAWLCAVSLITLGAWFVGLDAERLMGNLVIAALVLAWVYPSARPPSATVGSHRTGAPAGTRGSGTRWRRAALAAPPLVVTAALLYHVAIGAAIVATDIRKEVSHSRRISDFARENLDEPYAILTAYAFDVGGVMAYLDRDVYDVECGCWVGYQRIVGTDPVEPSPAREQEQWCALIDAGYDVVALFPDGTRRPDERHEIIARFAPSERASDHAPKLDVPMYRLADPGRSCARAQPGLEALRPAWASRRPAK